ncbi:MAG: YtxH domain-containing protein [Thiotrichales bacterium]
MDHAQHRNFAAQSNQPHAAYPSQTFYPGQPMPYPGYPMYANAYPQRNASLLNDRFLKGLLIGAAAVYLLTNENLQRTAIKSAVKAWSLLQGGVEELKERFHDAEAEIHAESNE